MKKSLILTLILGLVVIMAVPATAFRIEGAKDTKLYVGGMALTDIGYWGRSKELLVGQGISDNDTAQFILSVPRHSRFRTMVNSGNVGAYWELGMGRDLISNHEQGDNNQATDKFDRGEYISTRKIYGFYTFGNCTLLAGKNDGSFWSAFPYQNLGLEHGGHVIGFGWGTVYDDREAQVRFTQNVSKAFSYQISLVQPKVTDVNVTVNGVARNYDTIAKVPRIDAMVTLDWGMFSMTPAASWQQLYYDSNPPGYDNAVNIWLVQLPIKVKAGAFTFSGQVGYGVNLWKYTFQSAYWAPNYSGGKVKDSTGIYAFGDASFTAGAVTPHFYVGYDAAENDVYYGDKKNVRMMYGVGVNWKITDNFFIVPEFTYYDYGKNVRLAKEPDIGKEWLGGIQFQFVF